MMKKHFSILVAIMMSVAILAGCSNNSTQEQTNGPKVVKIGIIAPISGPAASYGEDGVALYKYVVEKFNAENSGKVEIQLVIEDGKCSGKDSSSAAQKLITVDKVDMIRGGMCSSETISAGKIAQANKVFTVAPVSSAAEISNIGNYVYRFYNDTQTAQELGISASQEFKNIALFTENTDFAIGLHDKFTTVFTGNISIDSKFQSDEKDFGILVNGLKDKDVDGLILMTQSEATTISILKALKSANLLEKFMPKTIGVYICSSDSFLKAVGPLAEGMRCFDLPPMSYLSQDSKDFIKTYKQTNTVTAFESWIILQKEAADMTLGAIRAGNYTSDSIRQYFEDVTKDNPRKGYFGNVYFNTQRDLIGLPTIMEKIENSKAIVIE